MERGAVEGSIRRRLGDRDYRVRWVALHEAFVDPHADALLSSYLLTCPKEDSAIVAALLGELQGSFGRDALLEAVSASGPDSVDLRCAALWALAKRDGVEASASLGAAVCSPNRAVQSYAVTALAAVGRDTAWEDVVDLIQKRLRRTPSRTTSRRDVLGGIAYLAQHVEASSRRERLVTIIRNHWDSIQEETWFAEFWPDAAPAGPSLDNVGPPDPGQLREWARKPLFGRSFSETFFRNVEGLRAEGSGP